MAVAFVRYEIPTGTIPTTFGSTTTIGDQLYCMLFTNSTGSGTFSMNGTTSTFSNVLVSGSANFTDGHGDTYSLWASPSAAGGAETFNVTQPSGATMLSTIEMEFSGGVSTKSPLYTTTASPGAGAGAVLGQSVTVTTGDLLAVCCWNADAFGNAPTVNTAGSTAVATDNNLQVVYWIGSGAAIQPNFTAGVGDETTPHQVVQWIVSATGGGGGGGSATIAWIT